MGRDTSNAAMKNSDTSQNLSTTYGNRATATSNILTPTLNRMATNPVGFGDATKAGMTTAAMQATGGGAAATVGGGLQRAAATNNAGAYDASAGQAGHDATAQLTDAALGVQNQDAILKEQQRSQGLQGLQQQYGTDVGAGENALGLSNGALAVKNQADAQTFNDWYGPFSSIVGGAAGVAGAKYAKGCWIAEAVYGPEDPRTHIVRAYLNGPFRSTSIGNAIMKLYLVVGQKVACAVRKSPALQSVFRPAFDLALARAVVPLLPQPGAPRVLSMRHGKLILPLARLPFASLKGAA